MNTVEKIMKLEGFKVLTPIQKEIVNRPMKYRDVIGISSTGSGKSHAFFMAVFDQLDPSVDRVQAVISAPTRELAYQLYSRCKPLADAFGVHVRLITGGMEKKSIIKQPQIVIGTPGRMKDLFINNNELRLDTASMMIIDEADMTLEFGFLEDIDQILSKMDKDIQIMVFSATIPMELQPFLKKYLTDPYLIQIEENQQFQSDVHHYLISCKHKSYIDRLFDVLPAIQPYVCLIFANTNEQAAQTANVMREHGYDIAELHGSMESRERKKAVKMITAHEKTYIVASDIASRGIDIDGITHVISMGFPKDLKYYIHRAGRTGRAQRDGTCIALYMQSDGNAIRSLEKQGIAFVEKDIKQKEIVDIRKKEKKGKKDELTREIEKIVKKKTKKVKPNYKKKQKEQIEKLKRKRKREMIRKDIQRQKKERAIQKQREKQ